MNLLTTEYMRKLMLRCVDEDGGLDCDITTNSVIPREQQGIFALHVRNGGTLAGLDSIADAVGVFGNLSMELLRHDGDKVQSENIAILKGSSRSILIAERTILNIISYASGIATRTRLFVDAVSGTPCKICDTRKTTPGLRVLDKYAVTCGGGTSHRMGLDDAALFKDNHIAACADYKAQLGDAIANVNATSNPDFVEVEVDSLEQLEEVLSLPVDIILLDNMSPELLTQAVSIRNAAERSPLLEASGGVHLENVCAISETGVDRISIGGLTHQSTWLDIGLDAING